MPNRSESESNAFHEFELAGWERIPAEYDRAFSDLTPQSAQALLDAAHVGKGTRVLDVACGPGHLAEAARLRGARVTAVDFSPAMVAWAKRNHPDVDFMVGDAEALLVKEEAFDAAVMSFGLLHLGQPERAIAEAHRVLRRGGRFAFTVWAPPEDAVGFGAVLRAVAAHGSSEVPLPAGPPFFRFSDPEVCTNALLEAGFVDPHVEQVPQTWRLESEDALFQRMSSATVRTGGLLRAQEPGRIDAIRTALRAESARYRVNGVVFLPMPAVLAAGQKP